MNQLIGTSSLIVGSALLGMLLQSHDAVAAPAGRDDVPFRAHVEMTLAHDDNIFRLEDGNEGLQTIGTRDLEDWYGRLGAGFRTVFEAADQQFEIEGDVYRQANDRFDELDHTGGLGRGTWNWRASETTRGDLGYGYRRELRRFSNRDVPTRDLLDEHLVFGSVDQRVAQRWSVRGAAQFADIEFSASPLLAKQRFEVESELRYDASQRSKFGLLASYTESSFEERSAQDFSGWSVGPTMIWQYTPNLLFSGNLSQTHQSLDDSGSADEEFDGITGYVAANWSPNDRVRWNMRLFRDISDLGGEVPRFTKRTGVSIVPTWQISPKLASRGRFIYEKRDFVSFTGFAPGTGVGIEPGRKDDYYELSGWLDLRVARRWLLSAGIAAEHRESNTALQEFDDLTVQFTARFDI